MNKEVSVVYFVLRGHVIGRMWMCCKGMMGVDIPCFMYDVIKTRKNTKAIFLHLIDVSFAIIYYEVCFIFISDSRKVRAPQFQDK